MADDRPKLAYKVLTVEQFDRLQTNTFFSGAPIDIRDGYIHLSTASQLAETLDKHFGGQTGLILLEIDLAAVGDHVRWEEARGQQLFPHLYGGLALAAVTQHWQIDTDRQGRPILPHLPR